MKNLYLPFLFCCFFLYTSPLEAQRFNAGVVLGMSFSQLDGDKNQGYNKLGIRFGARGTAIITKRFEVSTGLLFSQKGSSFQPSSIQQKIKLNYMEVPILFNLRSKYIKEKKFYRWQWFTGIAIGRLVSSSAEEDMRDDFEFTKALEFINTTEISHLIGVNLYLNRHWALGFENSVSLNKAYDAVKHPIDDNALEVLRNYLINFRLLYMLW